MRILLTGATGFLGVEILAELMKRKEISVVAWGRDRSQIETLQTRFADHSTRLVIEAHDLLESRPLPSNIDVVIHAAALRPPTAGEDPTTLSRVNVDGTRQIVRLAEQAGCRRILYVSTQAVYGSEGAPWSEDAPLRPETPYAMSKCDGETEVLRAKGIDATILRISRLYGITPLTRWDELPGRFAKRVSRGEPLTIHGNGEQRLDLIHARDAARAVVIAALAPSQQDPRIYNVGSGSAICLNELVELFSQLAPTFGLPPVTVQRMPDHPLGGMCHVELATSHVRKAFGWVPKIGLREGISEYLDVLSSRDSLRTRQ